MYFGYINTIMICSQARRNEKNSGGGRGGGAGRLLKNVGQVAKEDCSIEMA